MKTATTVIDEFGLLLFSPTHFQCWQISLSEDNMKQVKKKAHLCSYFQKRTSGKIISTATLLLTATAARSE